jgi:hypothetical protein
MLPFSSQEKGLGDEVKNGNNQADLKHSKLLNL